MRNFIAPAFTGLTLLLATDPSVAQISPCYLNFLEPTELQAGGLDRLPEEARGKRTIKMADREAEVSVKDGYRILYKNANGAAFVNLKVELSETGSYPADTTVVLDNFEFLTSGMRNAQFDVVETRIHGFTLHGFSRIVIDESSTLGIYAIFPGNDVVVYVYFQNMEPEGRHFKNVKEYRKMRDRFLQEYLAHLSGCS